MNAISPTPPTGARSFFNRKTLLAFVAGAALAGGTAAFAAAHEMCGWHRGMMSGTPSAADVSAHVEHFLRHFYREIDATDAQKAQIEPLVQQAATDLLPLRAQLQTAHAELLDGFTQADPAALETARATHVQLADQASKRIAQLLGDVAAVLTPEQRTTLAARLKRMHGGSG